jgi:hypothetical protein
MIKWYSIIMWVLQAAVNQNRLLVNLNHHIVIVTFAIFDSIIKVHSTVKANLIVSMADEPIEHSVLDLIDFRRTIHWFSFVFLSVGIVFC